MKHEYSAGLDALRRKATFLNTLAISKAVLIGTGMVSILLSPKAGPHHLVLMAAALSLNLLALVLNRRGRTEAASRLFCLNFYLLAGCYLVFGLLIDRAADTSILTGFALSLGVLLAGILISARATFYFAALNTAIVALAFGAAGPVIESPVFVALSILCFTYMLAVVSWLYQRALGQTFQQFAAALMDVRQNETRLRLILENLPVMVDAVDESGAFVLWNSECERVTGYSAAEIIGNSCAMQILYPEISANGNIDYNSDYRNSECRLIAKDGSARTVSWSKVSEQFPVPGWKSWTVGVDVTERRQAESALANERNLLRTLIDTIPDAIYAKDADGCYVLANRAMLSGMGVADEAQIIGKRTADFVSDAGELQRVEQEFAEVLAGRSLTTAARPVISAALGAVMWLSSSKTPLRSARGEVIGMVGVSRDVSSEKRIEQALAEERNLLRTIIDAIPDWIYVKDVEGRYILVNSAALRQMGYEHDEDVIGILSRDRISDEAELAEIDREFAEILAGQSVIQSERMAPDPVTGAPMWFSNTKVPLRSAGGEVSGIVGISRIVTEQKKAEIALRESEARLSQALKAAGAGAWEWDIQSNEVIWSEENYRVMGLPPGGVPPAYQNWLQTVHPEDRERANRLVARAVGQQRDLNIEFRVIWPDGSVHWVNDIGRIVFDEQGQPAAMYGIQLDITERKLAQEALRRSESILAETSQIARVGGWEFDLFSRELYWTDEIKRIHDVPFDYTPDLEDGINFYAPEYVEVIRHAVEQAIAGIAYDLELQIVTARGRRLWVRAIGQPVFDEAGEVIRLRGVFQDIHERKLAEDALRRSEANLQEAQQIARLGNFGFDLDTQEVTWSDEVYRIFGVEPGTPVTLELYRSLLHPADFKNVMAAVGRAVSSGEPYQIEHDILLPGGARKQAFAIGRPVAASDGHYTRIFGVVQDISERKQVEKALRESQQMLRTVLDTIPVRVFWKDRESVYLGCNRLYAQDFGGRSPEAIIGKSAEQLGAADAAMYRARDQRIIASGEANIGEELPISVVVEDKPTTTWLRMNEIPLRNDDGEIIGILGTYDDITERRRAEDARRASELLAHQYQDHLQVLHEITLLLARTASEADLCREAVLLGRTQLGFDRLGIFLKTPDEQAAIGTFGTDAAGNLTDERHISFDQDDRVFWEYDYDPQYQKRVRIRTDVPLAVGKAIVGQGWNLAADLWSGEAVVGWIFADNLLSRKPLQDIQVDILGLYGSIIGHLLAQKRADEQIKTLNAQLEQRVIERTAQLQSANHELETFAYSVSHDLRAPLRGIDGFSQALLEDYGEQFDELGKEYLARMRQAAQRMGRLIDDLLQLSRVTRAEMRRDPLNLSEMVEGLAAELRAGQPGRDVQFAVQPEVYAQGDGGLLSIALDNLLRNAWKFSSRRAGARVAFGCEQRDSQIVYFVRDNGVGFDMNYAHKLFGVFQRLHGKDEFEGTGIGLATVQRIIERHGGKIWAEGAVDEGAAFYFTL